MLQYSISCSASLRIRDSSRVQKGIDAWNIMQSICKLIITHMLALVQYVRANIIGVKYFIGNISAMNITKGLHVQRDRQVGIVAVNTGASASLTVTSDWGTTVAFALSPVHFRPIVKNVSLDGSSVVCCARTPASTNFCFCSFPILTAMPLDPCMDIRATSTLPCNFFQVRLAFFLTFLLWV